MQDCRFSDRPLLKCVRSVLPVLWGDRVWTTALCCAQLSRCTGDPTLWEWFYRDDQITSLLEERGGALRRGMGGVWRGERDTGRQVEAVEEDVAEKREEHSVTEMAVCLSSCLLRAIDSSGDKWAGPSAD